MHQKPEPSKYLPDVSASELSDTVVKIDINQPMKEILNTLSKVSLPPPYLQRERETETETDREGGSPQHPLQGLSSSTLPTERERERRRRRQTERERASERASEGGRERNIHTHTHTHTHTVPDQDEAITDGHAGGGT